MSWEACLSFLSHLYFLLLKLAFSQVVQLIFFNCCSANSLVHKQFTVRPWHDAWAISRPHPNISYMSWYSPCKILCSSSRIYFNRYNRINFKLILLTLLFKSLIFKTNLNCSCFLLLDIFSIVMQWGFCKYVLSKKIKTDIFSKSAFRHSKLIVIV